MAFKMKGHELPGPNQRKSPAKNWVWGGDKYHGAGKHPDEPHDQPEPEPKPPTPAKHAMDDWGFKHGESYHRGTTGGGDPAPGHGKKKDEETEKSSPATQTKSGKGNIFTKRGRKQRAINKYVKARKNIGDEGGGVTSKKGKKKIDKAYTKLHKAQRNTEHNLTQYTYDKEAGRLNAYQKQEQKKMLSKNKSKKSGVFSEGGKYADVTPWSGKKKKSPAKCPLVAALAPAVIGAMSKKKEK